MTRAYYNENDAYAAEWLRNLIAEGLIAEGDVDERDIRDVRPVELFGYTQCHFFAGIGVWSLALRLAGWPDNRPVWTGSCPCQPFSAAGGRDGFADERHLWPHWFHIIGQCRPVVVLGEQVASKDADAWIDLVQTDVEGMDYAFGCVPFASAGVGAPHIRERAYWVADAIRQGLEGRNEGAVGRQLAPAERSGGAGGMADTVRGGGSEAGRIRREDGDKQGGQGRRLRTELGDNGGPDDAGPAGPTYGFWRDADWLACRDGKWRPVEPGTFPLAHGAAARMGRLRAYGNAINAQAAAEFVRAYLEA